MTELEALRKQIDALDKQLLQLFEQRMALSQQVAEYKHEQKLPVCDSAREREKLAELTASAVERNRQYVQEFYELIFELSKTEQRRILQNTHSE